jgi:hypothetical protein
LKGGVQAVASAGSGGAEGMAERAVALAQQMDVLEAAVKANNPTLANQALGSVSLISHEYHTRAHIPYILHTDLLANQALLFHEYHTKKSHVHSYLHTYLCVIAQSSIILLSPIKLYFSMNITQNSHAHTYFIYFTPIFV